MVGLSAIRIRKSNGKYDVIKKVFIGLAISIPLLLIIVSLLSSADRVFDHFLVEISSSFGTINIGDFSIQGVIALIITMIVFSYLWSFSNPNISVKNLQQRSIEANNSSCDPIISITILSVINCVYVAFTIIQFAYMFDSVNHALPPDFTYAEYARRGFFELLIVTLINFSLLLSSIRFTQKGSKFVARTVQTLHSLLIFCTVVILFSAYLRMSLYEATYGYTYLRVLTHSFMIFLGVLFLIAFYKIWDERISLLKPYIVITIMAYVIINFANIDVIIAKNNIDRYVKTGKLDTDYLRNLSYDSIPELVGLLNDNNVSDDIKGY
ncbi:Putative membrane protein (fragment) [Candidatus Desulfosporosinus infrequens]|uniref:Membrane protein n=1 Tax=Candidatus Desulfosporosinus infrequens TaxID=2043169 RepID=A0A2U3LUY4_9FIRM